MYSMMNYLKRSTIAARHSSRAIAASGRRTQFPWLALLLVVAGTCAFPGQARAQSPELSMREFSSSQIKKGVRSIGFGGDGATWGNYALVWRDADTAIADYGDTHFTNGNNFHFSAVGLTTPPLWHKLAIYVIGMQQDSNNVNFNGKSAGFGPKPVSLTGKGTDHALFSKIAMPLGKGFSAGILLAYETSQFNATPAANLSLTTQQTVRYETQWRPSGGFGLAWQPDKRLLFGFRGLISNDLERRTDPAGAVQGHVHSAEFRLGGSFMPWQGALVDVGGTRLARRNNLAGTNTLVYHGTLGFEQELLNKRLAARFGLDETSPTAGLSFKFSRFKLDSAYVDNMGRSRVGNLFGTRSNSILFTFTVDYSRLHSPKTQAASAQAPPVSNRL
jgi:hypothetical protein